MSKNKRCFVPNLLEERIRRILAVASKHQPEVIILGAWGCGVYGNNCEGIASLWKKALRDFAGDFPNIIFALPVEEHLRIFLECFRSK